MAKYAWEWTAADQIDYLAHVRVDHDADLMDGHEGEKAVAEDEHLGTDEAQDLKGKRMRRTKEWLFGKHTIVFTLMLVLILAPLRYLGRSLLSNTKGVPETKDGLPG